MTLYVDGGCSGNRSKSIGCRWMVSVVTDEYGRVVSEVTSAGGSNNIAELIAVRDALQAAVDASAESVTVYTDSKNNIAWVYGKKLGKRLNDRDRVVALKDEIARLRSSVNLLLVWVPREKNVAGHYIERRYSL